jgi:cytochrome b involved in lipid metabolism
LLHFITIFIFLAIFEIFIYKSKQGEVILTGGDHAQTIITLEEYN